MHLYYLIFTPMTWEQIGIGWRICQPWRLDGTVIQTYPLEENHFHYSKSILEQKMIVRWMSHCDDLGSILVDTTTTNGVTAILILLKHGMTAFDHPIVHHGSVESQLIGEVNAHDMELYDVVMDMFER